MTGSLVHPTYLPFTIDQLRQHFSPVRGSESQDADRHMRYYLDSAIRGRAHDDQERAGKPFTPGDIRQGRQVEKDERFWVVCALMGLYHANEGRDRVRLFTELLERAGLPSVPGFGSWQDALAGELRLYFEVNLPSPPSYRLWLRDHLDERVLIPYVREAAAAAGARTEGSTRVDAMLIAVDSGVAVAFEAKVLSDASSMVTYDVLRNQIARNIDVLLDGNPQLLPPLAQRRPDRSFLVLLTPEVFRGNGEEDFNGGRLYSWLIRAYRDPADAMLSKHLPHRQSSELAGIAERLGWATWEDCKAILQTSCPWLVPPDLTAQEEGGLRRA
jgi:hypothetical protein